MSPDEAFKAVDSILRFGCPCSGTEFLGNCYGQSDGERCPTGDLAHSAMETLNPLFHGRDLLGQAFRMVLDTRTQIVRVRHFLAALQVRPEAKPALIEARAVIRKTEADLQQAEEHIYTLINPNWGWDLP